MLLLLSLCVDEVRQLWICPTVNTEDEARYNVLDAIFACVPNCKHSPTPSDHIS